MNLVMCTYNIHVHPSFYSTVTAIIITALYIPSSLSPGCVGAPVPGCEVKIIEPGTKKEMPADTDGEIYVHGDNVMKGYHKNQKANDEVFEYLNGKQVGR